MPINQISKNTSKQINPHNQHTEQSMQVNTIDRQFAVELNDPNTNLYQFIKTFNQLQTNENQEQKQLQALDYYNTFLRALIYFKQFKSSTITVLENEKETLINFLLTIINALKKEERPVIDKATRLLPEHINYTITISYNKEHAQELERQYRYNHSEYDEENRVASTTILFILRKLIQTDKTHNNNPQKRQELLNYLRNQFDLHLGLVEAINLFYSNTATPPDEYVSLFKDEWFYYILRPIDISNIEKYTITINREDLYPGSEFARPSLHSCDTRQVKSALWLIHFKMTTYIKQEIAELQTRNNSDVNEAKINKLQRQLSIYNDAFNQACIITAEQNKPLDILQTKAQELAQVKALSNTETPRRNKALHLLRKDMSFYRAKQELQSIKEAELDAAKQAYAAKHPGITLAFFQQAKHSQDHSEPNAPTHNNKTTSWD